MCNKKCTRHTIGERKIPMGKSNGQGGHMVCHQLHLVVIIMVNVLCFKENNLRPSKKISYMSRLTRLISVFTLKALVSTAADNIHKYLFVVFQRK